MARTQVPNPAFMTDEYEEMEGRERTYEEVDSQFPPYEAGPREPDYMDPGPNQPRMYDAAKGMSTEATGAAPGARASMQASHTYAVVGANPAASEPLPATPYARVGGDAVQYGAVQAGAVQAGAGGAVGDRARRLEPAPEYENTGFVDLDI